MSIFLSKIINNICNKFKFIFKSIWKITKWKVIEILDLKESSWILIIDENNFNSISDKTQIVQTIKNWKKLIVILKQFFTIRWNYSGIQLLHWFDINNWSNTEKWPNFDDINLTNCNFSRSNISNWNYKKVDFNSVNLSWAHIIKSNFNNCFFVCSCLNYANLRLSKFFKSLFSNISVIKLDFSESNFEKSNINNSKFQNCNFSNSIINWLSNWFNLDFNDCIFVNVNFVWAILNESRLLNCNLSNLNFEKSIFLKNFFKNCNLKNSRIIGDWQNYNFFECKFLRSSFENSYLSNVIFNNCDLSNVNFSWSILENVIFKKWDITKLNFERAKLINCVFIDHEWEQKEFCKELFEQYNIKFDEKTAIEKNK